MDALLLDLPLDLLATNFEGEISANDSSSPETIELDDQRSPEVGLVDSHLGKKEHCMRCSGNTM
ncbi:hypothetical protein ACLOJK_007414 [Asimina triloba]